MKKGKVLEVIYYDTSKMGNPRYMLVIQNTAGGIEMVYTKPNSSHGYSATNYINKNVIYNTKMLRNKLCLGFLKGFENV